MSIKLKRDDWTEFFAAPSSSLFRKLQRFAWADSRFQSPGVLLTPLPELFEQTEFAELLVAAEACPDFLQASPRFHFLCGIACEETGDKRQSGFHRRAIQILMTELLGSGAGTKHKPYRATFSTDEHDIMRALQVDVRNHQLVHDKNRLLDVITAHDGQDYWFDVTRMVAANSPQAEPAAVIRS